MPRPTAILLGASIFTVAALSGCSDPASPAAPASVANTSTAGSDPSASGHSPANEREIERAEAWAKAVDGLSFENERITVVKKIDAKEAPGFLAQGEEHFQMNRRTRAVSAFAHAVRAKPKDPAGYRKLGHAMIGKGKIDLALASFNTALDLAPRDLETQMDKADVLARLERHDEAIAMMDAVLARSPRAGRAHKRLAVWRYYRGELAEAKAHAVEAEAAGDPVPPQLLALIARAEG